MYLMSIVRREVQVGARRRRSQHKANTLNGLVSNDKHIIALAILSHCKLLASKDKDLGEDFKNKKFIQRWKDL